MEQRFLLPEISESYSHSTEFIGDRTVQHDQEAIHALWQRLWDASLRTLIDNKYQHFSDDPSWRGELISTAWCALLEGVRGGDLSPTSLREKITNVLKQYIREQYRQSDQRLKGPYHHPQSLDAPVSPESSRDTTRPRTYLDVLPSPVNVDETAMVTLDDLYGEQADPHQDIQNTGLAKTLNEPVQRILNLLDLTRPSLSVQERAEVLRVAHNTGSRLR